MIVSPLMYDQLAATVKVLEVENEELTEIVRQNSSNITALATDSHKRIVELERIVRLMLVERFEEDSDVSWRAERHLETQFQCGE